MIHSMEWSEFYNTVSTKEFVPLVLKPTVTKCIHKPVWVEKTTFLPPSTIVRVRLPPWTAKPGILTPLTNKTWLCWCGRNMKKHLKIKRRETHWSVSRKVINSDGSGRNCTRNSGSSPLPLPLWGSALNFASWNFAAAILNSGPILRP
jgi:hypothetical protein